MSDKTVEEKLNAELITALERARDLASYLYNHVQDKLDNGTKTCTNADLIVHYASAIINYQNTVHSIEHHLETEGVDREILRFLRTLHKQIHKEGFSKEIGFTVHVEYNEHAPKVSDERDPSVN